MTTREKTSALVAEFKRELQRIYGDRLKGVFLYGSRARGDAEPDSDVDVLVVLDNWHHYADEIARTSVATSELSLTYGLSISRVFLRERDWLTAETPLLADLREQAVSVSSRSLRLCCKKRTARLPRLTNSLRLMRNRRLAVLTMRCFT